MPTSISASFRMSRGAVALCLGLSVPLAAQIGCASQKASVPNTEVAWGVPAADAGAPLGPSDVAQPAPASTLESAAPGDQSTGVVIPEAFRNAANILTAAAQNNTRAWDRLAYMCDMFGHRLSGSKALEQAIDWSIETLKADGFPEARGEPVEVPHWTRGAESLQLTAPFERELVLLGLGNSVGTGRRPIEAEVMVVTSLDELEQRKAEVSGKIVLINQRMPAFDHHHNETGYGQTVPIRVSGPSAAAKHGAKALLIRSVTHHSLRTPHTGMLRYAEDTPKIPAAALPPADAEFLSRMVARNIGPIKVKLSMGAKMHKKPAISHNVIAELKGREKPDEIVVVSGHIDSWDVGDGAHDDGSGVIAAMEAVLMLKRAALIPKRTIRVVLFTNEENGLKGAKAYFDAHGREPHVAAIEMDTGSASPRAIGVTGKPEQVGDLLAYDELFHGLGLEDGVESGGGGADIGPLMENGVLGLGIKPDVSRYFDFHHTAADTVDKVEPADLQNNAAAMALMAYILAERDLPAATAKAPAPTTTASQ